MELLKQLESVTQPYEKKEKVDPSKWIYTANEGVEEKMVDQLLNGRPKGTTTYFASIDPHWKWRSREMNIWTGYNNEGKTTLLNEMTLCRTINEDIVVPVFSPENMPEDEFFMDLAETFVGKPADKDYYNCMSEKEMREAVKFLRARLFLIYPDKMQFTIENIELTIKRMKDEHKDKVQMAILDPYIKIRHNMQGEPEHLYASRFMMERVAFCRETDISYNLVMHQTTPTKNDKGLYPPPSLYRIKGGGTYSDSTDNVLGVHRPERGVDPTSTLSNFTSEKVKKQKLVGTPGTAFLNYDRLTNRFYEAKPEWLENKLIAFPDLDWRKEQAYESYSPLAKLKGDVRAEIVKKGEAPKIYGQPQGNGLADFEKVNPDDAPF